MVSQILSLSSCLRVPNIWIQISVVRLQHLGGSLPSSGDYAEMVCDGCMKKNPFLQLYAADTMAQSCGTWIFVTPSTGAVSTLTFTIIII